MCERTSTGLLSAIIATALFCTTAGAQDCIISPNPEPFEVRQPDGTPATVRMLGSPYGYWFEDLAGYPVLEVNQRYVYARPDARGVLVPTRLAVGVADPAKHALPRNVTPVDPPGIQRETLDPRAISRAVPDALSAAGRRGTIHPVVAVGTVKNLVIMMRYSDHGARSLPSNADIAVVVNQIGGDPTLAPTGSVRDHYLENSYGQLDLDSTVIGWLDVPGTEAFYANGNSGLTSMTWELIEDGLDAADPLVDFNQFDQDGDGFVDAITFVHSGYGAEFGGTDEFGTPQSDRMWSHKWSIPTWTSAEGISVSDYNINPGVWSTSGLTVTHIGVMAHEMGHFLGLPDLYDTDGSSQGIGNWDVMAGGAWGFDSTQQYPSHMSAWSKIKLGWLTPERILPGTYSAAQVETNPNVYMIDSGYPPGEFLLVENRQPVGFDSVIPQGGLAVWHVDDGKGSSDFNNHNQDEGYPGQPGWPTNNSHYRTALLQADGAFDMEQGVNRGDGGDPYHSGGVDEINGTTTPDTNSYQGGAIVSTGNVISSIGPSAASVSFDYTNAQAPTISTSSLPDGTTGSPYGAALFTGGLGSVTWTEYIEEPSYTTVDLGSSSFAAGGVAQGWNADEGVWSLALPFEFPYYETTYSTVHVSSNGFLDFVPVQPDRFNQDLILRANLRIAPLWDDLDTSGAGDDIFVDTSTAGQITIRWDASDTDFTVDRNFAVTLFDDGRIRFDYGSGNQGLSPTVGVSRSHSNDFLLIDGLDRASDLQNANSVELALEGSALLPGLSLSPTGFLGGTPTRTGLVKLVVRAQDSEFRYDQRKYEFTILTTANPDGWDSGDIRRRVFSPGN